MPSDDDRSEGLDDDALGPEPVLLLDETEDGTDASDLDEGETGSSVLGEAADEAPVGDDTGPPLGPPPSAPASDRVPLPAEEAAVHVVDDERARR